MYQILCGIMNDRERFNACLHFEETDRPPFYEWLHFWQEVVNRWRGEGLPAGANHYDYFGFDKREGLVLDFGPIPSYVTRILREDERHQITETRGGRAQMGCEIPQEWIDNTTGHGFRGEDP